MDGRSKVLVIESSYETCVQAVERVFAAFPLEIKGKNVLVKVNALRACNPDREAIVTHPALLKAVIGKLETLAPKRIIAGVCSFSLPIRPQPCTVIHPLAPPSLIVHLAPGSTVSSFALNNCCPSIRP